MSGEVGKDIAAACVAGRVRMLSRVVSGIYDARLRPFGVRSSQFSILTAVAAHGPLAPTEVSRRLCLEKSTLSRDLERLVDRGWITSTPGRGRGLRLEISESGRALLKELQAAWAEAQAEAETLLGEGLIRELFRLADSGALAGHADR